MGKSSKLLTILKVIISIYLVLCTVAIGLWVYLKFFKPDSFTNSAIYANTVEDINGKKSVMEINSYNNLFEVKFNYYTDYNSTDVIGSGVQILDFDNLKYKSNYTVETAGESAIWNWANARRIFTYMADDIGEANYESKRLCFYEESDNISYAGINNTLEEFGCFKIEIDGTSYALKLGKVSNLKTYLWGAFSEADRTSLSLLLRELYEICHSGTYRSGTFYFTINLQDYFDIFKFDGKEYKIIESDVFDTYVYVKLTNYTEDAKTAKDSIFGQVQYNTNWTNGTQDNLLNDHFSDKNYFILTEQNCKFTFDETEAKHIADINETSFSEYKDKNQNYTIVFDLDYLDELGIIFGGINKDGHIKDLNITSYFTLKDGVLTEVKV